MTQRILDTGNKQLTERPIVRVPKNWFNLSHDNKLSCNMGSLVPNLIQEVLPGDKIRLSPEAFVRFQPMIAPVMHRINVRSEYFFVPSRLLWPEWESFISPPTKDAVPPAWPYFESTAPGVLCNVHSLLDYMGLPLGTIKTKFSALPFAAYQKVYSDWYRDEDLNPEAEFTPLVPGNNANYLNPNDSDYFLLRRRNWDKDYFTSAKPWPQKGPTVTIPVTGSGVGGGVVTASPGFGQFVTQAGQPVGVGEHNIVVTGNGTSHANVGVQGVAAGYYDPQGTLAIAPFDVTVSGGTIEDLRKAEALQKFFEADSRGGTRYAETIKQHFDVYSPDARLQRAEYLGSTFQPLSISEVLNTSGETGGLPQGNMAGHGISVNKHPDGIHYDATEHGFLIGIQSVLPVTGYYQGIPKMFSRTDRFDYAWPEFSNLGEQPIYNRELLYDETLGNYNDEVFGYLPRYSEYRTALNRVAGEFRTSLDFWHCARKFSVSTQIPQLNQTFIEAHPSGSMDRIFAVAGLNVDHVLCHWYFDLRMERPLPRHVLPSI